MSASSKFEIQMAVPESPLVRFLEKPVNFPLLQESITELLGSRAIKLPPKVLKEDLDDQGPSGGGTVLNLD